MPNMPAELVTNLLCLLGTSVGTDTIIDQHLMSLVLDWPCDEYSASLTHGYVGIVYIYIYSIGKQNVQII